MALLKKGKFLLKIKFFIFFLALCSFGLKTHLDLQGEQPISLNLKTDKTISQKFLDRDGKVLSVSYDQALKKKSMFELSDLPSFLISATIKAEDNRFYEHSGVDFFAKIRAVVINLLRLGFNQGGSTITEQVVRLNQVRIPQTLYRKWLNIFHAIKLEHKYSKSEILKFYMNQVPFSQNRRGFLEAANLYFGRSLETLSKEEMLALVVMLKAPNRFDIRKNSLSLNSIQKLGAKLNYQVNFDLIKPYKKMSSIINAKYFLKELKSVNSTDSVSTIDRDLQLKSFDILKSTLSNLKSKNVHHGALLIIDHKTGDILSYQVQNGNDHDFGIDTVQTPRQPASSVKPFLYLKYLIDGHQMDEVINDHDYELSAQGGIHKLKNYSRTHYGELTIRESLANSLNIPAIKVIEDIGVKEFYTFLQELHLPLKKHHNFYGPGLALGNMEVSLFDMSQAYTCLANRGRCVKLKYFKNAPTKIFNTLKTQSSDIIRDVLSDPYAREKEFGFYQLSHQVGIKTGTSTDFKDSLAFVFNSRYLVGVWLGNLDFTPMDKVTGSSGALKIAKELIELPRLKEEGIKFKLSNHLIRDDYCFKVKGLCKKRIDLFEKDKTFIKLKNIDQVPKLSFLPEGDILHLAKDPRIPDHLEFYQFQTNKEVDWYLSSTLLQKNSSSLKWNLHTGTHNLKIVDPKTHETKSLKVYVH